MIAPIEIDQNLSQSGVPSFPMERTDPLSPPPAYQGLRDSGEMKKVRIYDGREVWLATRYDDVKAILSDARFSASPRAQGFPFLSGARRSIANEPPMLNHFDAPDHTTLRRVLTRDFMTTRIAALRPRIESIVDQSLEQMIASGSPADFVKHFALPIPSTVIAEMLGVPYEDHDFFQHRSLLRLTTEGDPSIPIRAGAEMDAYFDKIFTDKVHAPEGQDIVSRLARDYVATGLLKQNEAVRLCTFLLQAGHETTGNMISLGTLMLMQNPETLARIKANPELVPQAVEEMLRYLTIVHFQTARAAMVDVTINGVEIKAGDGVYALINSANRDATAFPQPDAFDIDRKAMHHVAFSYGVHQCLGQPLARLELQIVFTKLFQRLPNLRLGKPASELRFKHDSMVYGVYEMPVIW